MSQNQPVILRMLGVAVVHAAVTSGGLPQRSFILAKACWLLACYLPVVEKTTEAETVKREG